MQRTFQKYLINQYFKNTLNAQNGDIGGGKGGKQNPSYCREAWKQKKMKTCFQPEEIFMSS